MDELHPMPRRSLLGLMAAAPLSSLAPLAEGAALATVLVGAATIAHAAVPLNTITVMYRRESPQAPGRLEPVSQAATLALEREFRKRDLRVVQPSAEIYQLLDQGQGVVITFATDAGLSLMFSAYADIRPLAGQDAGIAEVRLATRIFVGRTVLVAEEGRGQVRTSLEPATREFGQRRGLEVAAARAAADVAEKAMQQLQALTPERLQELLGGQSTSTTTSQVVPISPAPAAPPSGMSSPPPLPPSTTPAPAAAPMPAPMPEPAPAPVAPAPPSSAGPVSVPRQRYAIVVGMSDYSTVRQANPAWGIGDLRGVATDTQTVIDALKQLGYSSDRMTVLRDQAATGTALRGAIKSLAGRVQADDAVVIFIAGHGMDKDESVSGFGMPVLADHRAQDPGVLDYWELQSFVKNLRGRVMWINDTCHSGGAANNIASVVVSSRGVSARNSVRGPDAATVASQAAPGQDFAILTACSPSELSLETAEGGLFTTTLFKELVRTKGQVPLGQVFADTVARQVIDQSRTMCKSGGVCGPNPQQTPTMAYAGNGAAFRL